MYTLKPVQKIVVKVFVCIICKIKQTFYIKDYHYSHYKLNVLHVFKRTSIIQIFHLFCNFLIPYNEIINKSN